MGNKGLRKPKTRSHFNVFKDTDNLIVSLGYFQHQYIALYSKIWSSSLFNIPQKSIQNPVKRRKMELFGTF